MKQSILVLVAFLSTLLLAYCSAENPIFETRPLQTGFQTSTTNSSESIPIVKTPANY